MRKSLCCAAALALALVPAGTAYADEQEVVIDDPVVAVQGDADGEGIIEENGEMVVAPVEGDPADPADLGDPIDLAEQVQAEEPPTAETPSSEDPAAFLDDSADPEETSDADPEEAGVADADAAGAELEASTDASAVSGRNMYRLYNPNTGEHFYTSSLDEAVSVAQAGWRYEGVGWVAPSSSSTPVYRLYNPNAGDHHYTTSAKERDRLVAAGWKYEGIGWYSEDQKTVSIYREYNANASSGSHHYSASSKERDNLVSAGWRYEGIGWYARSTKALALEEGRWIVTSAWGSLERYWIGTDGTIARSRLVSPDEGTGYYAYAKSDGAVVRGKWDDLKGHVYVANNAGRLASTSDGESGWLTTSEYDGESRRYYLDMNLHAARSGIFTVDGSKYYGVGGEGYVELNDWTYVQSKKAWYKTDAQGRLGQKLNGGKIGYQNPAGYPQISAFDVKLPSYATGYWTYVMPCRIKPDATREELVETFIDAAMDYLGTRWVNNQCSYPGDVNDCSGLVMEALYACGVSLDGVSGGDFNPYTKYYYNHHFVNTWRWNNTFMPIPVSSLQRGDLVYWDGHVAIYLGNDQILDCNSVGMTTEVHSLSGSIYGAIVGAARPFA